MANKKKFDPAYINWSLYNKDRAEEIFQLYYDDFKRQEAEYQQSHTKEEWDVDIITGKATLKHRTIRSFFLPEDYTPKALFYYKFSVKDLFVPYFHVIRPRENYTSVLGSFFNNQHPFYQRSLENPSNSDTFRVILSSGEIINFKGEDLGEGMAGQKEIIISNGDTQDYVRLDFETFSEQGKVIKSFLDLVLAKDARIFDFKRKCWFIKSEIVEPLLAGLRKLIDQGTLNNYQILDKREIVEDFEDFFHNQEGLQAPPAKTKQILINEFSDLCILAKFGEPTLKGVKLRQINVDSSLDILELKPYYRKAALALHPDRNNGDGSKMAQLNVVWTQLQEYLK